MTAILRNALIRVRRAREGQRNNELYAAACTIGGLLDAAGVAEADAERVLLDQVRKQPLPLDDRGAIATIRSGIGRGRQSPLTLEGSPDE